MPLIEDFYLGDRTEVRDLKYETGFKHDIFKPFIIEVENEID